MSLLQKCTRSAFDSLASVLLLGFALGTGGCSAPGQGRGDDPRIAAERIQAVVQSPIRTDQDRGMDASRHPAEFLSFAQARPGMQVLDIAAGGGYTSQLLALAVGDSGRVWAQRSKPGDALNKRLAEHPQANLVFALRPYDDPVPEQAAPLDLVTLVLNYHDITYLPVDRASMNQHVFAALKPGGHFIVIDHSAKLGADISSGKTLHRIDEAVVLAEVQKAGFRLEAEASFLRNPDDARETPMGDMKIPTDRFVLRFVKP